MKKIIALALSLILVLSLSVTAFAAGEITSGDGAHTGVAKGTYAAGDTAPDTWYVDVTWSGLDFTYNDSDLEWDPEAHEDKVKENGEAYWTETNAKVVVINHSNVAVVATASATKNAVAGNNATISFGGNNGSELRAANKEDGAETVEITVTPDGDLASTWVAETKIFDLTLTLSAPNAG